MSPWKTILGTSGSRTLAMMTSLITVPLSARLIGPEGRGAVAAVTSWVSMFGVILYFSQGQAMMKQAAGHSDRAWIGPHAAALGVSTVLFSVLGWLVAAALIGGKVLGVQTDLPVLWILLAFLQLPMLIWEQHASYVLMALERLDVANLAILAGRALSTAVSVAMMFRGHGPEAILVGSLCGQFLTALLGARFILHAARGHIRFEWPVLLRLLRDGAQLHPGVVGIYFANYFGLVILSASRPLEEVGHFQMAQQLVALLQTLPQAASMVLYGRLAALGPREAWSVQRQLLMRMGLLVVIVAAACHVLAPWMFDIVAGVAFRPAVPMFRLLLVPFCLMAIGTVMTSQWIGRGWFLQYTILNVVMGLSNLGMSLALVRAYGAMAIGLASVVSSTMACSVHLFVAWRLEREWRQHTVRAVDQHLV